MKPDLGKQYLDALDKPRPERPAPKPGEGPRKNGISLGTRTQMRQILEEAEELEKKKAAEAKKRAKLLVLPKKQLAYMLTAVLLAGLLLGYTAKATLATNTVAPARTVTTVPGKFFCRKCHKWHETPKRITSVANNLRPVCKESK